MDNRSAIFNSYFYGDNNSEYLEHYGVKGQKWGVRRYQNDDGTLTAEGKERYGEYKRRKDTNIFRKTLAGEQGDRILSKVSTKIADKMAERRRKQGRPKRAERFEKWSDAQKASTSNVKTYREHSNAGKLFAQNLFGGSIYRHARARGDSRISAMIETGLMATVPLAGLAMRAIKDKKVYDEYLLFGDNDGETFDDYYDDYTI